MHGIACQRTRLDMGLRSYDASLRGHEWLFMRWESSTCWSGLTNFFKYGLAEMDTRVHAGPLCPQRFFSPPNVSASVKKIISQLMRKHNDKNSNILLKIALIQGYSLILFFMKVLDILPVRVGRENVICAENSFLWYRTG